MCCLHLSLPWALQPGCEWLQAQGIHCFSEQFLIWLSAVRLSTPELKGGSPKPPCQGSQVPTSSCLCPASHPCQNPMADPHSNRASLIPLFFLCAVGTFNASLTPIQVQNCTALQTHPLTGRLSRLEAAFHPCWEKWWGEKHSQDVVWCNMKQGSRQDERNRGSPQALQGLLQCQPHTCASQVGDLSRSRAKLCMLTGLCLSERCFRARQPRFPLQTASKANHCIENMHLAASLDYWHQFYLCFEFYYTSDCKE